MNKKILAAVLPFVYAFITIFITYEHIEVFLLGGLVLLAAEFWLWSGFAAAGKNLKQKISILLPFGLLLASAIGISASATLTREKIELIKNPDHVTSCSVSPIVACSPVIGSDEASIFADLPNPLLGIFGFTALAIAGFSLLAGGKFATWWWRSLWLGSLLGFGFVLWLMTETLYDIGALCIYCMAAWTVTIPTFTYLTVYNVQNKHITLPKKAAKLVEKRHLVWPVVLYAVIILLIYFRFDYYWNDLI